MKQFKSIKTDPILFNSDISDSYLALFLRSKIIGWDIETSGLSWRNDLIGTCQLYSPGESVAIVKIDGQRPANLCTLLASLDVKKVFHHAMFDLRFMSYKWNVHPQNVACTKIAAKLLDPKNEYRHSLQAVLKQYLNIMISKDQQVSDWLQATFSAAQLSYAANDVIHLTSLLERLEYELTSRNLFDLAQACFDHLPVRARLDILGYEDLYSYTARGTTE